MPVDERTIDEKVLLPVALRARPLLKSDPEKWTDYEVEQIRLECGHQWAAMPLQNIRRQCCNLRRAAKLGTIGETKNHGAACREDPPEGYKEYLKSPHWLAFRQKILKGWEYRCCWCYSEHHLDVHHRTYQRLGKEKMNDCVCLCRECHQAADRARQRAKQNAKANEAMLFEGSK